VVAGLVALSWIGFALRRRRRPVRR
jgi:hypothetical protein